MNRKIWSVNTCLHCEKDFRVPKKDKKYLRICPTCKKAEKFNGSYLTEKVFELPVVQRGFRPQ